MLLNYVVAETLIFKKGYNMRDNENQDNEIHTTKLGHFFDNPLARNPIGFLIFCILAIIELIQISIEPTNVKTDKKRDYNIKEYNKTTHNLLYDCKIEGTSVDISNLEKELSVSFYKDTNTMLKDLEIKLSIVQIFNYIEEKFPDSYNLYKEKAFKYFQDVENTIPKLNYDSIYQLIQNNLENKNWELAFYLYSYLTANNKMIPAEKLSDIYYGMALVCLELNYGRSARVNISLAIDKANEYKNSLSPQDSKLYIKRTLDVYYSKMGKIEQDGRFYESAINYYEQISDKKQANNMIKECNKVKHELEQLQKAESLYKKAINTKDNNLSEKYILEAIEIHKDTKYENYLEKIRCVKDKLVMLQQIHDILKQYIVSKTNEEIERNNKKYNCFLEDGKKYLNNGNLSKALDIFEKALIIKKDAQVYFLRGKTFLLKGACFIHHALSDLEKAVKIEPENAEYNFYCGKAFYAHRMFDKALLYYTNAINLKDDNWECYYNLGVVHYESMNYSDAVENYYKSVVLNPELINDDKYKSNIKYAYEKLLDITDNNDKAHYLKALFLYKRNYGFDDAIRSINRAIELNNTELVYQEFKDKIVNKNGNEKFLNDENNIIEDSQDESNAQLLLLASQYMVKKDYENCLIICNKLITNNPNDCNCYAFKSRCNSEFKFHTEAIKDLENAIKLCDDDKRTSTFYFMIGMEYAKIPNHEKAINNYDKAICLKLENKSHITEKIITAENFLFRGLSYLLTKKAQNFANMGRDFAIAFLLDRNCVQKLVSYLKERNLSDEVIVEATNVTLSMVDIIEENCRKEQLFVEEYIPIFSEIDFNINKPTDTNQQFNIDDIVNKVRKIDI